MLVGMFLTFQSCRSSKEMCIEFSGCRKAFDLIRLGTFSQGQAESVLGTWKPTPARSHPSKVAGNTALGSPKVWEEESLGKAASPTLSPLPSVGMCWGLGSVHDAAKDSGPSMRLWQNPFLWPLKWFICNLSRWGKWVFLPVQSLSSPVHSSLLTRTFFPECFVKVYNSGNTKWSKMHLPQSSCQHQGQATWPSRFQ